ncbi:alkaline phosphatase family protein [Verticiella sediminum]
MICDSLRRDLIDQDSAPAIHALAQHGTCYANARSVFPSTTRVSSASIATGCLPARHGLLGNRMLLEEDGGLVSHDVGAPAFRDHLFKTTGRTLLVPTLAERVREHGGACIMSNVSPGAAYFHDPDGHGHVLHRAGSFGPGRERLSGGRGLDIPSGAHGDRLMTQRFCALIESENAPAVATLWLSEPDHSGHREPLGSPAHRAAIAHADACVNAVWRSVRRLREAGVDVLLLVGSDHGMETVIGEVDVAAELRRAGLIGNADGTSVAVAANGSACVLGLAQAGRARAAEIAGYLSRQPWCGTVHRGDALADVGLPESAACTLAISLRHSDAPNGHGVPGSTWIAIDTDDGKHYLGAGQHGGLGRYEQSPFLIACGGGYPAGAVASQPVGLIDYAPTILRHLGLPHDGMDGSPLPLPLVNEAAA